MNDYGITAGYANALKSIIRETLKQKPTEQEIIKKKLGKELTLEEMVEAKFLETMEDTQNDPNVIDTGVMPTKLAIVGFAPNWDKAPFEDDAFEIWGLNELYKYFGAHKKARADRWFEIHSRESPTKNVPEHIDWLQKCPMPLYMHEHYEDMLNSLPYPADEVLKFVSDKGMKLDTIEDGKIVSKDSHYATNSITWMLLLGWMEGFKEIHIYGVDLACDEEYLYQRPNLEYYIGGAQVDGIKVVTPASCDLLKASQLYGFESDNSMRVKMKTRRAKDLEGRKKPLTNEINKRLMQIQQMQNEINDFKGQLIGIGASQKEIDYWLKNWVV